MTPAAAAAATATASAATTTTTTTTTTGASSATAPIATAATTTTTSAAAATLLFHTPPVAARSFYAQNQETTLPGIQSPSIPKIRFQAMERQRKEEALEAEKERRRPDVPGFRVLLEGMGGVRS